MSRQGKVNGNQGTRPNNGQAVSKLPRQVVVNLSNPLTVRQEPDPEAEKRYAEERNGRQAQIRTANFANRIAIISAIVTFLGLLGLYLTFIQTRNQFALDERPYMVVHPNFYSDINHKKVDGPVSGKPLIITLGLDNIGKSPARNVNIKRYIFFGQDAKTQLLSVRENPDYSGKQIVFSNQGMSTTAVTIKDSRNNQSFYISPNELVNWDGGYPILVFGNIYYSDGFRNKYCTEFAFAQIGAEMHNWLDTSGKNTQGCDNP